MGIPLFILAVSLMFSGAHGISQSMSCSIGTDGKMICNRETSQGNAAMSSSSSFGPGGSSQHTYSGVGDSNGQWQSSGQTVNDGSPGGYYNPSSGFANTGSHAATGGGFDNSPGGYYNPSSGFAYSGSHAETGGSDGSPGGYSNPSSGFAYSGSHADTGGSDGSPGGYSNPSLGFAYSGSHAATGGSAHGSPSGGSSWSHGHHTSAPSSGSSTGPVHGLAGAFGGIEFPGVNPLSFVSKAGSFVGSMVGEVGSMAGKVGSMAGEVGSKAGGAGSFGFSSAGGFPSLHHHGITHHHDEHSGDPPPQGSNNGPGCFVHKLMNAAFGRR